MNNNASYMETYTKLLIASAKLGFPEEFGKLIAKNLGSEKAMNRMTEYLVKVKPRSPELVADEMLAIMEDRNRWAAKKEAEDINSKYNEFLNRK